MRKRKLVFKTEVVMNVPEDISQKELEEFEEEKIVDVTMNPSDYFEFRDINEEGKENE